MQSLYSKCGLKIVSWYCRYHFSEFSYLRVADKKHGIPEHIEKTVLFLVDPSAVAKPDPNAQNLNDAAALKWAAEAEATAAMKAAWKVAKEAKEVCITRLISPQALMSVCQLLQLQMLWMYIHKLNMVVPTLSF